MAKDERVYTERMEFRITKHMLADLQNVSRKNGQPVSAVVRQAVRNYLDGTDLTLGTRRTFDRRFQKRMEALERRMEQHLLTLLILCASQFAEMPGQNLSGSELLKRAASLAAGQAGGQVRRLVMHGPDPEAEG